MSTKRCQGCSKFMSFIDPHPCCPICYGVACSLEDRCNFCEHLEDVQFEAYIQSRERRLSRTPTRSTVSASSASISSKEARKEARFKQCKLMYMNLLPMLKEFLEDEEEEMDQEIGVGSGLDSRRHITEPTSVEEKKEDTISIQAPSQVDSTDATPSSRDPRLNRPPPHRLATTKAPAAVRTVIPVSTLATTTTYSRPTVPVASSLPAAAGSTTSRPKGKSRTKSRSTISTDSSSSSSSSTPIRKSRRKKKGRSSLSKSTAVPVPPARPTADPLPLPAAASLTSGPPPDILLHPGEDESDIINPTAPSTTAETVPSRAVDPPDSRKRKSTDPPQLSYYGLQPRSSRSKRSRTDKEESESGYHGMSWTEKINEVYRHFLDIPFPPSQSAPLQNSVSLLMVPPLDSATASLPPSESTSLLASQLSERVEGLKFDKQPSRSQFYRGAPYKIHNGDFTKPEGTPLDENFRDLMGKGVPSEQIRISDVRLKDIEVSIHKALQVSAYIHWFAATAFRQLPTLAPDSEPQQSTPIPNTALHTAALFSHSLGEAVLDLDRHLLWMISQLTLIRRTAYIKQLPNNTDSKIKDQLYSAPLFKASLFGDSLSEAINKRDQDLDRRNKVDIHTIAAKAASPRRPQNQVPPRSPRTPKNRQQTDFRNNSGPNTPNRNRSQNQDKPRTPAKSPRRGRGQKRF